MTTRRRNPRAMLRIMAQQQPEIQTLIDRISDMSDNEIYQINQPRWVRQALFLEKKYASLGHTQNQVEQEFGEDLERLEQAALNTLCEHRVWYNEPQDIKPRKWPVPVKPGTNFLLFYTSQGPFVKIEYSGFQVTPQFYETLKAHTRLVGHKKLTDYRKDIAHATTVNPVTR